MNASLTKRHADAMGQMVADSDIIVEKLNAIDEGVKGPQTMKAFLTRLQLDAAIKAWNKVCPPQLS